MKKNSPSSRKRVGPSAPEPTPPSETRIGDSGVVALIHKFENQIAEADCKVSVGDYIRLLQVAREQRLEKPKNVEVRWIDPPELQQQSSGE